MGKGRLRAARPLLALFWYTLLLMWDSTGLLRLGLAAALLHELGHVAVYWALLRRLPRITVSLWGLCLSMGGAALTPGQTLLLAAAGPAANAALAAAALLGMGLWGYTYGGYWFAAVNLLTGGFNLLPVPGLDGAVMLGCAADLVRARRARRRERRNFVPLRRR